MKLLTTLTASAILLSCAPAMADDDNRKHCEDLSDAATMVMSQRQEGVPLRVMLDVHKKQGWQYLDSIAIEAYSNSPLYSTDAYRKSAISEFANKKFLECLKGVNK